MAKNIILNRFTFYTVSLIFYLLVFLSGCSKKNVVNNSENGVESFLDILTPEYYNSSENNPFKTEVNNFLEHIRTEEFQHPLKNNFGQIPSFTVPSIGEFGAGKGPTGTSQHHPAVDLHVGDNETNVSFFAAYDGYTHTFKDAQKYRHYLSITKEVFDESNHLIGKLVTLYAHLDLDLDETDSLNLNGQYVCKGDIVSRHLYSGTVGGPHLHFEIRYYRPSDDGIETFYGFGPQVEQNLTEPSSGDWPYGYWNPHVGYGFGDPENHGLHFYDK